ncbi:MAG: hypothetical protein HY900_04805 [Deltaproteobacteria bacterium]|nr:hypothetical protein [Deltaproteobacteria bacterium]
MKRRWLALLVAAFGLAVAGCSGGSGGGGLAIGPGPGPGTLDTDGDGTPNSTDTDDDNDGIADAADGVPLDAGHFATFGAPVALDGLGGTEIVASAINDFGQVVGAASATAGGPVQPVVWSVNQAGTPGDPTPLVGLTEGTFGVALGNNDADQVVGEAIAANGETVAVLWPTVTSAPVQLPSLDPAPSNARGAAFDITDQGLRVGQAENAFFVVHPVAWSVAADGTVTGAQDLQVDTGDFAGTPFGRANAAAGNGLVVGEMVVGPGGENDAGESRAVAWKVDPATLQILAGPIDLGKIEHHLESAAFSVNENGVVVGESVTDSGEIHAVRWKIDPVTMTFTGPIDLGSNATATAVNDSGRIAGDKQGPKDACTVWDTATTVPTLAEIVAPTATSSNRGVGINNLGQVVGIEAGSGFVITPN